MKGSNIQHIPITDSGDEQPELFIGGDPNIYTSVDTPYPPATKKVYSEAELERMWVLLKDAAGG